jgi:hypothetical protein
LDTLKFGGEISRAYPDHILMRICHRANFLQQMDRQIDRIVKRLAGSLLMREGQPLPRHLDIKIS